MPPRFSLQVQDPPPMDSSVWRILDVQFNRATEGLRVVEEYLRLVLDDPHLSSLAKQLRHDLTATARSLAPFGRLALRDTLGDVGTQISTPTESQRADPWDVASSNFSRVQESLRTLEEYGKLVDAPFAKACESLRYRTYTLEKCSGLTARSLDRLRDVQLCALVDGMASARLFEEHVGRLVAAGVPMIQLRDKSLTDGELVVRARRLVSLTRPAGSLAIVNDRADIAMAAGADGVHVGQEDLPPAVARRIVGPRALVGVSTHSISQAREAVLVGADYLGVGPTFPSMTKPFKAFPGLDLLREVAREIALPAFAIGGIALDNLPQVLETGIDRVAISAALEDPAAAPRFLDMLSGRAKLA